MQRQPTRWHIYLVALVSLISLTSCQTWSQVRLPTAQLPAAQAITHASPTDTLLSPTIIIAGDSDYPPYEFLNDQGEPDGFNVDLIRAVAQASGLRVEIRLMPWDQARAELEAGQVNALAGMYFSEQRDQLVNFSIPHNMVSSALFVRDDTPIRSFEEVRGKAILVQKGDIMDDVMRTLNIARELVYAENAEQALQRLANGEADGALLSSKTQALYLINQNDLSGLRLIETNQPARAYGFAVRQGDDQLLYQLNEGLDVVKSTGEYRQLHDQWFGVYEDNPLTSELVRPLLYVLVILLFVIIAAVGWTMTLRRQVNRRTQQLRVSEEKYRLLVENATEGVVVVVDRRVAYANQRACEILSLSQEDLRSRPVAALLEPEDEARVCEEHARLLEQTGQDARSSFRIQDGAGRTRWLDARPVHIEWEGQPAMLELFTDVTDQRLAQEQINVQLEHMEALRQVDQQIIGSVDLSKTLRMLLEQLVRHLKVDAADILVLDANTLERAASFGFHNGTRPLHIVRLGDWPAGVVAQTSQPIQINDMGEVPVLHPSSARLLDHGYTAYYCLPLVAKDHVKGVLELYARRPLRPDATWHNFLQSLAGQAAIALDNHSMYHGLGEANKELREAYDETIAGWARALEERDGETEGHSQRVTELTEELARALGFSDEQLVHIRRGALLHDIGKMAIPDNILRKPGPLTPEEWKIMRKHPRSAVEMLCNIRFLQPAIVIPQYHHERWDGSGYNMGLSGEEIPFEARIFAVVDVYDALRSDRPYRDAWPEEKVLSYIADEAGRQFDPQVVQAFLELLRARAERAAPPLRYY